MQIVSQLATAVTSQTSSSVTSSLVNGADFHEALLAATTRGETPTHSPATVRGETPAKSTATGPGETSGKAAAATDSQSAGQTSAPASGATASVGAAASEATSASDSTTAVSGQSAATSSVPSTMGTLADPTIVPGDPQVAGNIAPAADADDTAAPPLPVTRARTSAPAAPAADKKSKSASTSADASTGPSPASTDPLANANFSVQLAGLPTPLLSAPVNEEAAVSQASTPVSVSGTETAALPMISQDLLQAPPATAAPVSTDSASTDSAGADADIPSTPAAQAQPNVASALPIQALPAAIPANLLASDSGTPASEVRAAQGASPASTSSQGTASSTGKKSATGNTAASVSQPALSAAATTTQDALPSLSALSQVPTSQIQKADPSLPSTATSAAGKDRSVGDVHGKRKDNASESPAPGLDSTTASPTAVTAKTADTQSPTQGDANDPRSADPAAFQKVLDGSQTLTATNMPAPTQSGLPSTSAAPAAATPQPASGAATEASADPAVTSAASSAQLIQSAGQTEMRVGMHSAEFGNLSISTSVSHQAISAQITTDHSELGRALAVHMPSIEEKLGTAYGLHARVEVRDESAASRSATNSGQQGGGYQEQSGGTRGGQSRSGAATSSTSYVAGGNLGSLGSAVSGSSLDTPAESSRLDIRI